MKKSILLPLASLLAVILLSGCQGRASLKCEAKATPGGKGEVGCGGEIEGSWGKASISPILRPFITTLAEYGLISYDDYTGLNIEDFAIHIEDEDATLDQVIVYVKQDSHILGSRTFKVSKDGNKFKFSSPSSVKEWGAQFIDVANNVDVEFNATVDSSSTTGISLLEKDVIQAKTTLKGWVLECDPKRPSSCQSGEPGVK